MCWHLPVLEFQWASTFPTIMISDKTLDSRMLIWEMPMESLHLSLFSSLLRIKLIFASSIISLHFLSWQPFMNFWVMDQESFLMQNPSSRVPWTVRKLLLSMKLTRHGTVSLEKLHPPMKNAKLTQLVFTYLSLRTYRKFFCQNTPNKKDGTLFMLNGST